MPTIAEIMESKVAADFVNMNNKLIDDNIEYRREWEEDCKKVQLSYRGNKFPVRDANRVSGTVSGVVKRSTEKKAYLNLVKRQWRVISNYLLNNEPQYLITEKTDDTQENQLVEVRELLDLIFDGSDDENEGFYDTVMDDTIFYGIHRGICWTLAYFDDKTQKFCFKSYDSLDTYIDLGVDKLSEIRKFLTTFTRPNAELKTEYKTDGFGGQIDWDKVGTKDEQTASNIKESMIVEKQGTNSSLIREGYYLEDNILYRVRTTKRYFLSVEILAELKFMPVTYYSPQADPGELYPRGWFVDMIELEKEINLLIAKMSTIIKTGGRFVYVKSGTSITKSTSNVLNSLGIEVFEINNQQEMPKQASLLQITQADIQYLDLLMRQCEDEGGMKGDIMGNSSTGANASGRAIQALQAGSKNNIGGALNELNKYMNRLVRILMRMFVVFPTAQYYSATAGKSIETGEGYDKNVKVKVSITGRDAFDEVTKQMNAMDILNMILKFAPDTKIPPSIITKIMGVTNDIADEIQEEMDKQEDPDLQIAEGQTKKMLQGIPQMANENDNHQVFIAIFSEALKNVPPDTPAGKCLIDAIRMHEAFMQVAPPPAPSKQPQ